MKFDPKKTVFLIDGSSFLYRAYYGLRPLHTPQGVPVQAVYSFCRMIKKMIDSFSPAYIALVWDSKGKTTRHEMYQDYKATRLAPPSDLFDQKKLIMDFADAILLPQISQTGIEADDIMYSIAREQTKNGFNCVFVTSDKDMGQALDASTVMYDFFKDEITDVAAFELKRGFPVEKLPFYFAILGDASDNIPGVKGIGKTGATELVQQFNNLEDLYNKIEELKKDRLKNALLANKENAFLSHKLFLLSYFKTDATVDNMVFNPKNWINAKPLFEELEFKSLLKDIQNVHPQKLEERPFFGVEKNYSFKCITKKEQLTEFCEYLKNKNFFAFDSDTDGLDPFTNQSIGFSFCAEKGLAFYIPFGHKTDEEQLTKEEVVNALRPILESPESTKTLHNANFDQLILYNSDNIYLKGIIFDSILAANLESKIIPLR